MASSTTEKRKSLFQIGATAIAAAATTAAGATATTTSTSTTSEATGASAGHEGQHRPSATTTSAGCDGLIEETWSLSDAFSLCEVFQSNDSKRNVEEMTDEHNKRRSSKGEGLAHEETKAVQWLRMIVLLVLLATAVAISAVTYFFTNLSEQQDFQAAFDDEATRVIESFRGNAKTRVGALESFAMSITSHARFVNTTWPFVTLPDFERRGLATLSIAQVMSIIMVPLVTDETRDEWEAYSVANQGWLAEGLAVEDEDPYDFQYRHHTRQRSLQQETATKTTITSTTTTTTTTATRRKTQQTSNIGASATVDPLAIPEHIYRVKGLNAAKERGPGPYLPQWQIAPAVPVPGLVNFNLLSHTGYHDSLTALLEAKAAIVGRSFDFSDPNDEETAGRLDVFNYFLGAWESRGDIGYNQDPVADIHIPLYDDYNRKTRKLVGLLTCVIYWKTYLVDILTDSIEGVMVVLKNTCDQEYTYVINGADAQYVGPGDLHDPRHDAMEVAQDADVYMQANYEARDIPGSCFYSIHVYPSDKFENKYISRRPILFTIILMLIFCFTSAVFFIYDCLVERRQRIVMSSAVASDAIVTSLFPKEFLDRLYHSNNLEGSGDIDNPNFHTSNPLEYSGRLGSKRNATTFPDSNNYNNNTHGKHENPDFDTKPIANLYKDCTVLFADLAGFTSWSSKREPGDVFTLLERLYDRFDSIAKKCSVFKVETIGDCYLAVTGLPEPQEDHAVRMAIFSHDCLRQIRYLLHRELRELLGDDISKLSVRFGMHSGPVTGGILRGDKSRFQLFGDTVNTAARMESTGTAGRIQVSQETRDSLAAAGKEGWCDARDDLVDVKGKGTLQTYWLRLRKMRAPDVTSSKPPEDFFLQEITTIELSDAVCEMNKSRRQTIMSTQELEEMMENNSFSSFSDDDDDDDDHHHIMITTMSKTDDHD